MRGCDQKDTGAGNRGCWLGVRGRSKHESEGDEYEGGVILKQHGHEGVGRTGDAGEGRGAVRRGREVGHRGTALSGIDGDNLTAAPTDQEDPVETLSEDLQEFHVWEMRVKETQEADTSAQRYQMQIILHTYYIIHFYYII